MRCWVAPFSGGFGLKSRGVQALYGYVGKVIQLARLDAKDDRNARRTGIDFSGD